MTFGSIYKIQFPNGKYYIGLTTTSLEQRKKEHKYCAKNCYPQCLYKALIKYDMVDTFELIQIDTAETLEELCEMEIIYIIEYNSHYINGKGYNMTFGGEGLSGYIYTEKDKQKQSEKRRMYFENNPTAGKEHSERMKKYFQDNPEAGKEHSERMKNYFQDNPEAGKEHSERMTKYYEDNPDAGKEHSEIMKKYFQENLEAGKEHSERMKKYYQDNPEAREQMSEIKKKYFENPKVRQKHSEIRINFFENNPEAREQMSEIKKKYYEDNPNAGKEQSERLKKYYENNPEATKNRLDKKGQNKPFDVFTTDKTFIKTFTYQFEAREYLQKEHHVTSTIKIGQVLLGTRGSSAGFVFKYK